VKLIRGKQLSLFGGSYEIGVSRAARLLSASLDDIYKLIDTGAIKAYRLHEGGWWKISYDSVIAYRNKIRRQFGLDEAPDSENPETSDNSVHP
jgi:excisionase family DNA binding protein